MTVTVQQIDTDAVAGDALLTAPRVIALYEAVRYDGEWTERGGLCHLYALLFKI